MTLMSTFHRKPPKGIRSFGAALALALVVFWAGTPPSAAGCSMSVDPTASGSVTAPNCCTDGSCPRLSVEIFHPEGVVSATPSFAPSFSRVALVRLSPMPISPLASIPPGIFREARLPSPLRI